MRHPEKQYLNLIKNIIKNGVKENGRNGITKSIIGAHMRFPLTNNQIPLLTTKKLAWKSSLKELLWFVRGETDNEKLQEEGVKIWNENGSREFLDSRGLTHYEENDLGPIYGYQWRYFNKRYTNKWNHNINKEFDKFFGSGDNIDQLQSIIDKLKKKEYSRRLIMTAWNPCQLNQMALPPCHVLSQFHVLDNKLHCTMYQRSGDVGLGIPFNIASYSFLTILLARHCGLEPGEFIHFIGNAHIYEQHEPILKIQISREPKEFPKCYVNHTHSNISNYKFEDFTINDYDSHTALKMKIIV